MQKHHDIKPELMAEISVIKTLTKQHTWDFLINCQPCLIWIKCAYKDI